MAIIDNSKLTYRKNLKLAKAPFSVDESSKITGSKKVNGKTEYTTGKKANLSSLIPYASNAYNAFRKLPKPIKSELESPINANLINLDAARNNIDTNQRVLNRETDYRVSNPAVAQAIKATTIGKAIQGRNELAQEEGNSNAQIKNQTNQFNQGIYARNIERGNQFNRDTIQRDIAQQNLLSENLANVGDKYQEQSRDKSLMELENRKLSYLPEFYNKNEGFYERFKNRNPNTEQETYENGGLVSRYNKLYGKANSGIYAFGGEVDPSKSINKKPITKDDFTPISWKSQGVMDSTGRAPMYKTTNAAFYGLNKAPIPQGVDPNAETYSQIDSLDRKLGSTIIGKPVSSYARDIYGNIAPSDQGRIVSRFKDGGKLPISNSLLEYYENTAQPVANIGEKNPKLRELNVRLANRNKRFYKSIDNISKTKFKYGGGLSRSEDYGSKSHPYPSVSSSDFAGGGRSYPIPTIADAQDALRLAHLHGRSDVIAKVHSKYPSLKSLGGEIKEYSKGGWIKSAVNPSHKGYCTPMTKATCTPRRKALAMTFKKHHGFHS